MQLLHIAYSTLSVFIALTWLILHEVNVVQDVSFLNLTVKIFKNKNVIASGVRMFWKNICRLYEDKSTSQTGLEWGCKIMNIPWFSDDWWWSMKIGQGFLFSFFLIFIYIYELYNSLHLKTSVHTNVKEQNFKIYRPIALCFIY